MIPTMDMILNPVLALKLFNHRFALFKFLVFATCISPVCLVGRQPVRGAYLCRPDRTEVPAQPWDGICTTVHHLSFSAEQLKYDEPLAFAFQLKVV